MRNRADSSQNSQNSEAASGILWCSGDRVRGVNTTRSLSRNESRTDYGIASSINAPTSKSTESAGLTQFVESETSPTFGEENRVGRTSRSLRRTVLLAEDDPLVRTYSAGALASAGFDVDAVENGTVAWQLFQQESYDLLISDNDMPGMTGVELIARIRRESKLLPIILISGSATAAEICRQAGFENMKFLPKPFTRERLIALATEMLASEQSCQAVLV